MQSYNANEVFAKFMDWGTLNAYCTLICANGIVFGVTLLLPERFVSASAMIAIDILIDVAYIVFNVVLVETPSSYVHRRQLLASGMLCSLPPRRYWPIIIPLMFSVDMLHDSFTRTAQETVTYATRTQTINREFAAHRANGTFVDEMCAATLHAMDSGEQCYRQEARTPSGYKEFAPRLYNQDSDETNIITFVMQFTIPDATPGQVFTFQNRYTPEERGTGTQEILQVYVVMNRRRAAHR